MTFITTPHHALFISGEATIFKSLIFNSFCNYLQDLNFILKNRIFVIFTTRRNFTATNFTIHTPAIYLLFLSVVLTTEKASHNAGFKSFICDGFVDVFSLFEEILDKLYDRR